MKMLKNRTALLTALLAGGLATVAAPALAHAQSQDKVQFKTPFGFQYGNSHLPAGTYIVRMQTNHVTLLQSSATAANALTTIEPDREHVVNGKVVFRRYGSRYFLREVWIPGQASHLTCARTKTEKQAEAASKKAIASNEPAASNVQLAMLEVPR